MRPPAHWWGGALFGAALWFASAAPPHSAPPAENAVGVGASAGPPVPARAATSLTDVLLSDPQVANAHREEDPLFRRVGVSDRPQTSDRIRVNAARMAALDARLPRTYVLVNLPQARLWMIRDGRITGTMRVVVGRPDQPTPRMATELTHVVLNPRWHVPQDIVRSRLAPQAALTDGRSLTRAGYEVMSGWGDDAVRLSAGDVDWRAVAEGRREAAVRQKPGVSNVMGRAKFVIRNDIGIYLHDTPTRELFARPSRTRSAGCIRVEDYRRLLAFVLPGVSAPVKSSDRPTYVRLAAPVPVYITYITAVATGEGAVLFPDPYGLDASDAVRL